MRELPRKEERPVACAREFRPKFIPPRSYLYTNPRTYVRGEAAKLLGLKHVPTLTLSHLSPAERRAYMLADNKLAQQLRDLINIGFDLDLIGFSLAEIDLVLDEAREASPDTRDAPEDALPERSDAVVTNAATSGN